MPFSNSEWSEESRQVRVALSSSPEEREQLTARYFELLDTYGIACFVSSPEDMLMWSYYAASHNGIVVRFRSEELLRGVGMPCLPLRVNYTNDFPRPTFYSKDRFDFVQKTLGTKAEAWKHEAEWRVVLIGLSGYVTLPAGVIDGIIFGLRTPVAFENEVRSWVSGGGLSIEIMRIRHRPGSFLLELVAA